jgi:hypothetical protein
MQVDYLLISQMLHHFNGPSKYSSGRRVAYLVKILRSDTCDHFATIGGGKFGYRSGLGSLYRYKLFAGVSTQYQH